MSVLFVDDDPEEFELFSDALQSIAPSVTCTWERNCAGCLERLQSGLIPDILFMDVNMPLVSGFDCILEVLKLDHCRNLRVVVYSGMFSDHQMQKLLKCQNIEVMIKPKSFIDLQNSLRQVLNVA